MDIIGGLLFSLPWRPTATLAGWRSPSSQHVQGWNVQQASLKENTTQCWSGSPSSSSAHCEETISRGLRIGQSPLLLPLSVFTFPLPKCISQRSPEKRASRISVYVHVTRGIYTYACVYVWMYTHTQTHRLTEIDWFMRNWLTQLWRLRYLTVCCHLHSEDPGKAMV